MKETSKPSCKVALNVPQEPKWNLPYE